MQVINGELDIITVKGDQNIQARKAFECIHLENPKKLIPRTKLKSATKLSGLLLNDQTLNNDLSLVPETLHSAESQFDILHYLQSHLFELQNIVKELKQELSSIEVMDESNMENDDDHIIDAIINLKDQLDRIYEFILDNNPTRSDVPEDFNTEDKRYLKELANVKHFSHKLKDHFNDLESRLQKTINFAVNTIENSKKKIRKLEGTMEIAAEDVFNKPEVIVDGLISGYNFSDIKLGISNNNSISCKYCKLFMK